MLCGARWVGVDILNSIERLDHTLVDSGTASWQPIDIPGTTLSPRKLVCAAAISNDEIVILGGCNDSCHYLNSAVVFDVRQLKCTKAFEIGGSEGFYCEMWNPCSTVAGIVVMKVKNHKYEDQICKFNPNTRKLQVIKVCN